MGTGHGDVHGERLKGRIWWCNHARRNETGVWHPDLHGFIRTDDGSLILVDIEGHSVPNSDDTERELRCTVRFHTDSPKFDWLNYAVAVVAGSFDPKAGASVFKVYEVVSE